MVFKRVLKGIGRLMLTTAVMCGVGLFLCSSEVKATGETLTVEREAADTDDTYTVKFSASTNNSYEITEIKVKIGTEELFSLNDASVSTDGSTACEVASFKLLEKCRNADDDGTILGKLYSGKANQIEVSYKWALSSNPSLTTSAKASSGASVSNLYKIDIPSEDKSKYLTNKVYKSDDFSISAHGITYAAGKPGYLFGGESFDVNSSATTDYYVNVFRGNAGNGPDWHTVDSNDASVFKDGTNNTTTFSFNAPSPAENVTDLKVQYFPKLSDLWYEPTGETIYLDLNGQGSVSNIPLVLRNSTGNLGTNDRLVILNNMKIAPCSLLQDGNGTNIKKYDYVTGADGKLTLNFGDASNHGLLSVDSPGSAIIKATALKVADPATQGPINQVTTSSSSNYVNYTVYAYPTGISILKNGSVVTEDKINVSASNEYTLKVLPGGADQTINYATITNSGASHAAVSITNNKIKITGSTSGTDTITVKAQVKTGKDSTIEKSTDLAVTVVALDKDKTISKINDSNENYITVGDYKLDVASLVSKYATDGTNHIDGITPKAIKITSGSDYAEVVDSTKIKGKKEGTVELSIFLNTTDTSTTPDLTGVKIGVYPKPTATYSSSNRTLTVKMPTKVSTGYGEEKNIRKTTGFKLLLEDSSGNTLYEYTDSKYQKVLSSSSDKTVSYTVTASDIEGMVTSAASNGKFSSDTTSVKFKVTPMGYKQSNSEDETIKAKDEIAGTTDAVTVYKVSASGTNFSSTAAYGLDGQTVSLTATPNSGYTFKQWSDGNTSNPRQIKVSASGTRSFQAVAGERVANSTGAGGTDNSALYDDVPKTSESNSAIWLIVFMVFAVMGTTYALYLQLRAANSKHDR